MFFSKKSSNAQPPDVFIEGQNLTAVSDFKYLGIILASKKHVKKVANTIKFNSNFRHLRPYITTKAAKLFMHTMVSHLVLLHKLVTSKYNNSENNRDPLQADLKNSAITTAIQQQSITLTVSYSFWMPVSFFLYDRQLALPPLNELKL